MQNTVYYYQYHTSKGIISLIPRPNGRYSVMYQDEDLGSYHSPMAAAGDVSGGTTFMPSNGVEFDELDIPDNINEWQKKVFATINRLRPC